MGNKDYLQWKYARNYQETSGRCYKCKTKLEYRVETICIGNQTIQDAKVLTCVNPKCLKSSNES